LASRSIDPGSEGLTYLNRGDFLSRSDLACRSPTRKPVAIASHYAIAQRSDPGHWWNKEDPSNDRPQSTCRHECTGDRTGTSFASVGIDPPCRSSEVVTAQIRLQDEVGWEPLPRDRLWRICLSPAAGDPVRRGCAESTVAVVDQSGATVIHDSMLSASRSSALGRDSIG